MKKRFSIIAMMLAVVMSFSLIGCGGGNDDGGKDDGSLKGTYNIKMWVADAAIDLTQQQVAAFNETNTDEIVINAEILAKGEGDAGSDMLVDVEAGPDIYCFAQDQFARLVQGNALSKLGTAAQNIVSTANDAGVVAAATFGTDMYAYPMTADNGYFLYYDKSIVSDDQAKTIEGIVAACEAAGAKFAFELEGSAWYAASFFFGAGCVSEWEVDTQDSKKFTGVHDTFNSEKGMDAVKGMYKVVSSDSYFNSSKADVFAATAGVRTGALVSGTWVYSDIVKAFATQGWDVANLCATKLPTWTVGEGETAKTYQLGSFNGCKLMGVKPTVNAKRSAVLHKLAQFLTDKDRQVERFNTLQWGPANKEAAALPEIQNSITLKALFDQMPYSVPQGQIHGSWWDIGKLIATDVKAAKGLDDTAGLQNALTNYQTALDALFTMSDEEKNAFTVIGSINGDTWTVDLPMTKVSEGVWKTNEAYDLVGTDTATEDNKATEFKVRQGKAWDVAYGEGNGNYVVATTGKYYIQLTVTAEGGTIELIPATAE